MIPSKGGGVPAMHKYLKKKTAVYTEGGWVGNGELLGELELWKRGQ